LEGGPLYDPASNYNRVKGKWSDWSNDPEPIPAATRTVDSRAQTGETQGQ
jgi:outer membrane protein